MKDNAFTAVSDPDAPNQAAMEIDGKLVQQRIDYWMNLFFKLDKGKYATRSKHLNHEWYLAQVEVCSNVIFKSARSHSKGVSHGEYMAASEYFRGMVGSLKRVRDINKGIV